MKIIVPKPKAFLSLKILNRITVKLMKFHSVLIHQFSQIETLEKTILMLMNYDIINASLYLKLH